MLKRSLCLFCKVLLWCFLMAAGSMWIFILLEVFIVVACCLGNALVIWVVWRSGALRQPSFCFIASLAVADFLVGSVAIPVAVLWDARAKTSFHGCLFMCCVFIMLQLTSGALLLAIAVDRFLRVRIPLTYKATITKTRSWMVVVLCWLVAALLSFIPMFGWHHNHTTWNNTTQTNSSNIKCSYLTVNTRSYVVNFIFFSCYLPPLAIMCGLYLYVFLITRRQLRANIGETVNKSSTDYLKERRLAASLALVLVLFAVSWLPVFVMHTIKYYNPKITVPPVAIRIGVVLSHANSAVNPIIYAFRIPKFKKACIKLWVRLYHCREDQQESDQNSM
ncbi:adenosine receptor A1-like [Astyanax mexicanus]|uniref:Adenosine receptor A1-like n=1 Tax=Astyanax mexicanus TaxID=7994 RepID=A0A8T2M5G6_ASTMX|nr:adenosine receptor A1-like [Astyanax mexicanus]